MAKNDNQLTFKVRINTVCSIWRIATSPFREEKEVPVIRLCGLWLKSVGFDPGKKFEIYPGKNHLLLKTIEGCADDST